jgi:hypothetical protein
VVGRQRSWFAILGILVIALVGWLTVRSMATPTIGQIQAIQPGPYEPGQRVVLSLPVESRSAVFYQWSNANGGPFEGSTTGSSVQFVAPREGSATVTCTVVVDGRQFSREFPIHLKPAPATVAAPIAAPAAPAEPAAPAPAEPAQIVAGESAEERAVVLQGIRLGRGLGLGIDTSEKRRDWVRPTSDKTALELTYPGDPVYGAVFITVGALVDRNRPGWDYSTFRALEVELKGATGTERVEIGVKSSDQPDNGLEAKVAYTLAAEWKVYSVPLSAFKGANLKKLYVVAELVFDDKPAKVFVRRIQYVK